MFFRVEPADANLSGRPLDLGPALRHVAGLAARERYDGPAADRVTCEIDRSTPPYRIRLRRVRGDVLPMLEDTGTGTVRPLRIRATEGVSETTHLVLFADGTVGAEFNFYGPRASRMASYLFAMAPGTCPQFHLEALLNPDTAERLRRLERIRVVQLKIRSSYIPAVRQENQSVGDALAALQAVGQAQTVEVSLGPQPYQRGDGLAANALRFVRGLARRGDLRNGDVRTLHVDGYGAGGDLTSIDLLNEQLLVEVDVIKLDARSRAVDSASAYAGIEQAQRQVANEIRTAMSVR